MEKRWISTAQVDNAAAARSSFRIVSAPSTWRTGLSSVASSERLEASRKNVSSACSIARRLAWISDTTCAISRRSWARRDISSSTGTGAASCGVSPFTIACSRWCISPACCANSSPRLAKFSTAFSTRSIAVATSIATLSLAFSVASPIQPVIATMSCASSTRFCCFSSAARARICVARSRKLARLGWWPEATLFQAVFALPTISRSAFRLGFCGAPSPFSSNVAGTVPASRNTSCTLRTCSVAGRARATANSASRISRSATVAEPSISRLSCCSTRLARRVMSGASGIALAKSASKKPSATHQNVRLAGLVCAASTAATAARMSSTPLASFLISFRSPRW